MNDEKSLISRYRSDFNDVKRFCKTISVKECFEEPAVHVPTVEERLNEMNERINNLALTVGVPYVVSLDGNMSLYPARESGVKKMSDKAVSYTVDLKPYRGAFAAVRFQAQVPFGADADVVRGVIVDDEGGVECAVQNGCEMNYTWTRMPISPKSSYLVATVPLKDGEPAWVPDAVEFVPGSVALDATEIMRQMMGDIKSLAVDVYELHQKVNKD